MADAGVSPEFTGGSLKSTGVSLKSHSGAARCRRCGVVNPIHAAFIKGLGDRRKRMKRIEKKVKKKRMKKIEKK